MSRHITYLVLSVLALSILLATPATAATTEVRSLRHGIQWQRSTTWRWQDRAGVRRTPTEHAERHTTSVAYLHWINKLWLHRRLAAKRLAHRQVAHHSLWLCIHGTLNPYGHYEARNWSDPNSGGNGHYGGLQMSSPWGKGVYYVYRADWLTPGEQMRKAELGYRASGYSRTWLLGQWNHPECLRYA